MTDNPCDNCIIDVMCTKICDRYVDFMKDFSSNSSLFVAQIYHVVDTWLRLKRAVAFAEFYRNLKLFDKLLIYYTNTMFNKLKQGK